MKGQIQTWNFIYVLHRNEKVRKVENSRTGRVNPYTQREGSVMLWVHIHTSSHGSLSCIDSPPLSMSARAGDTWGHRPSKTADTASHRVF